MAAGSPALGVLLGACGAVIGTSGGYSLRTRLTRANGGHDRPVALAEDAVALAGALLCVAAVS
jgi:uncharacterized membrane protein